MWGARSNSPRRQWLRRGMFLVAIIAPSVLLVTLSVRLIEQDRELADKRADDRRRLAAAAIAQRLTVRLEQLKLQALAGGVAWHPGRGQPIALTAIVDQERLILPWDSPAAARRFRAEIAALPYAAAFAEGEHREFNLHNRTAAHAGYGQALAVARSQEQRAAATLALLRTSPPGTESERTAIPLLQSPVLDEEGVPLSLYAARMLLERGASDGALQATIVSTLRRALDVVPPVNLVALHMVRELAESQRLAQPELAEAVVALRADARVRVEAAQQAHDLQASFGGLLGGEDGTRWVPFGPDHDLWLVIVTRPPLTQTAMAVAVRAAASLEEAGLELRRRAGNGFEPLGARYAGLFLKLPADSATRSDSMMTLVMAIVFLTLAIALSGSWFFWRDVQRDVRLAELRSQFVASVSHELKTPLTAIRMFAETLRMGRTPPERTAEYLDTIVSESERLTRLMNNVLEFSKVEQGTRRYQLSPQALAPIIRSAARTLEYPLAQQAFSLRVAIDDEGLFAVCDADALEQSILNLLSNAMKYSGASRAIEFRLSEADGGAAIVVRDFGMGIPAAEQSRIFEKFYRGASDAHQRIAGTGLGLTLVQHAIRGHRGTVSVDSRPGSGSTFTILLPTIQSGERTMSPAVAGTEGGVTPAAFES